MRAITVGILILLAPASALGQAEKWKPAEAPIMTPWAKDVSPDNAWPEYPRPQMVRSEWVNLNGLWDYAIVATAPIADASGRKHEGNVAGAPVWKQTGSPAGGAIELDGINDNIRLPRMVQDDFTIAFWMKTTQKAGTGSWFNGAGLVDGECAGITDDFGTALVGDYFAFGVGRPDTTIKSTTPVNDDKWHHVAAVRERATGNVRLFVDGKQEAEGTGGKQALTVPRSLMIGALQTGINRYRGSIADVRIYDRALAAEKVAALERAPKDGAGEGLVGWWRFDKDWRQEQPKGEVTYQGKILVPFPVESALSGVRQPLAPWQLLYYHRKFKTPDLNGGKRLLLHFGAVDWEVKVYVNGKLVGEHRGGFDAFSIDITDAVKAGENDIVVVVFDPTGGTRGKQNLDSMLNPGGIMYTPCSGIWQTVWLEAVPARRIDELEMIPDIDAGILRLKVHAAGVGKDMEVEATALDGERVVARVKGQAGAALELPIKDAKLWSPSEPFLYGLKVKLGQDEVTSYFGMRKVSLGKDEKGITRILLNNKFVFQAGVLDQGYWPDGIYTAPTDEALRFDVEMMRKLGLNMARKHVKVEPQRWYYWCDKLGLLVWQDMPSGDISKGNEKDRDGEPLSADIAGQYKLELQALIAQHKNHPSIIMWVVFNEGWGQHDTVAVTKFAKSLDPSRFVSNASGWHDRRCGDIIDIHDYPGPGSPQPEPTRAAVLGEFGGLGLAIPGHTWTKDNWGYKGVKTTDELTRAYIDLWRKVWRLKDEPGLSAVVYTQWTDVETECNGLLTYDRKVVKVDAKQVADAHQGKIARAPGVQPSVAAEAHIVAPVPEAARKAERMVTRRR